MVEAREDDTWDDLYRRWAKARETSRDEEDRWTTAARRRIGRNPQDDWRWLAEAVADPERKWFVAGPTRTSTSVTVSRYSSGLTGR